MVFDLGNGLVDCISELVSCRDRIDGLICINDFCALPLMRVLDRLDPDWNAKMLMLGFSDTTLAALHKPALTSVSLNYEDGGRAVVRLHRMLAKHEDMAHLHFIMKSSLLLRDTTEAAFPPGMRFSEMTPVSDAEIFRLICTRKHFMMLENLLNYADTCRKAGSAVRRTACQRRCLKLKIQSETAADATASAAVFCFQSVSN